MHYFPKKSNAICHCFYGVTQNCNALLLKATYSNTGHFVAVECLKCIVGTFVFIYILYIFYIIIFHIPRAPIFMSTVPFHLGFVPDMFFFRSGEISLQLVLQTVGECAAFLCNLIAIGPCPLRVDKVCLFSDSLFYSQFTNTIHGVRCQLCFCKVKLSWAPGP